MKDKELKTYTKLLKDISEMSTCVKYKVGAILVKDGRIVATGYNGTPSGFIECQEMQTISDLIKYVKTNYKDDSWEDILYNVIDSLDRGYDLYKTNDNALNELLDKLYDMYVMKYRYDENNKFVIRQELVKSFKNDDYIPDNHIHSRYEVHAEMNVISLCPKHGINTDNCELICSYLPCLECAKIIVSSGIKVVYYLSDYIDKRFNISSIDFFNFCKIPVRKIDEKGQICP